MFLQHSVNLKSKVLIQRHIPRIVGFQRNHQPVGIRPGNHLLHEEGRQAVVLHFRANSQINHMKPVLLVELVRAIYVHQGGALEVVFRFQDPYRQILDQAGGEPPAR